MEAKKLKPELVLRKTSLRVLNESELTLVAGAWGAKRDQVSDEYQETRSAQCPENDYTQVSACITMTQPPLTQQCPLGGGQRH